MKELSLGGLSRAAQAGRAPRPWTGGQLHPLRRTLRPAAI